ncbi:uncharacterized protein J3D65DRAFT_634531 [Phyllosticta citribraziliensis]|uniref:F-box domain-containing protein n=1 Tax=Phyllosticta citribraziliensis TaxID=989973 RepID=A0ABR1LD37_9PEZI
MSLPKPSAMEILLASMMSEKPVRFDDDGNKVEQGNTISKPGNMILDQLSKADLLALRATSTTVKACVEADQSRYHSRVFEELVYHGNVKNEEKQQKSLEALSTIAPYCKHLGIYLYDTASTFDTPGLSLIGAADSFWMQIFAMLSFTLTSLAISAPGMNTWDWLAYGAIERQIGAIRVAMESSLPRGLTVLSLDPINAGALLYLRWRGASILSSSAQAELFWSNLVHLKVKLFNPLGHLTPTNSVDFLKTLHDFLGSFRRSLRALSFEWLGPQGPSPLFLDMSTDFEGLYAAHPFQWSALTFAHLENVDGTREADFDVLRLCRAMRLRDLNVDGNVGPLPVSPSSVASVSAMDPPMFDLELADGDGDGDGGNDNGDDDDNDEE